MPQQLQDWCKGIHWNPSIQLSHNFLEILSFSLVLLLSRLNWAKPHLLTPSAFLPFQVLDLTAMLFLSLEITTAWIQCCMVDPGANLTVLVMTGSLALKLLNETMPVSVAMWNVLVDKQPESLILAPSDVDLLIYARLPGCNHPLFSILFWSVSSYLPCFRLLSFDNFSKNSFSSCSGQLYCHSALLAWMIYRVDPRTLIRLLPPLLSLIVSRMLRVYLPRVVKNVFFRFYCNQSIYVLSIFVY